mgnify:FL=1|jgi:hypothetical protein
MEIYMNILFYDMGSYTYQDTLFYLKQLGHTCKTVYYHFPNKFHDDFFCDRLEKQLQSDSYDAVMSINFFPLAAALCHEHQLPYLAWCYDIPASRYAPWILWVPEVSCYPISSQNSQNISTMGRI